MDASKGFLCLDRERQLLALIASHHCTRVLVITEPDLYMLDANIHLLFRYSAADRKMASASSSHALAAVQRFVDEHSAEFIMSLHNAAAQLRSNHGLSRRVLADVVQMAQSPEFCDELAAHVADLCPSKLAEMFSRDIQVNHPNMPPHDIMSDTGDMTSWSHTFAVLL